MRKNKPSKVRIYLLLYCSFSIQVTCPVHALLPVLDACSMGEQPFAGITPATALGVLRPILLQLGIERAGDYWRHDLRRRHAHDLQPLGLYAAVLCVRRAPLSYAVVGSGPPLWTILQAGEWRTPVFMSCLFM